MWRPPLLHPRQTGLYENQSSSQVCPKELAKGTTSSAPNTAALDPWLSKEASPQQSPARPGSSATQTPCPARWRTRTRPRQAPGGPHPRHSEWHLNPSRSWLYPAVLAQALCPQLGLTRASHSTAFGSFKIWETFLTHLWRQT